MLFGLRRSYTSYKKDLEETLRLSGPVIVAQLGLVLMGVIDNMMIGDIGYEYLSAASLGNSIYFIVAVLGMGITFAISPLVAEADAAGDIELCGLYLRQGVFASLLSALILCLVMLGMTYLLPYMDQPIQDVQLGTPYLNILNISLIPMLLFLAYKQFSDGLSFTKAAMYVTLAGLFFNVFVNWLLIYGNWGFPRLELIGAGIGTLSSRTFMLALIASYINYSPRFQKYSPALRLREWKKKVFQKIFEIGLPSGLQYFFEVGAFAGAVIMIGWIGIPERSAHQIVINIAGTTYMLVSGLAAGAAIRVGNALGRNDVSGMKKAGFAGIYLGAFIMFLTAILFITGKNWLPALYVDDSKVLLISAQLMIIGGLFQIFDGVQAVGLSVLRGMQDVRIPTIIAFISYWIIALPVGYLLAFNFGFGVNGIWYGFVISLGFAAFALVYRFQMLTSSESKS
ncbi:MAG: MATE family efflux transporter [Bacteroidota bacterium]